MQWALVSACLGLGLGILGLPQVAKARQRDQVRRDQTEPDQPTRNQENVVSFRGECEGFLLDSDIKGGGNKDGHVPGVTCLRGRVTTRRPRRQTPVGGRFGIAANAQWGKKEGAEYHTLITGLKKLVSRSQSEEVVV